MLVIKRDLDFSGRLWLNRLKKYMLKVVSHMSFCGSVGKTVSEVCHSLGQPGQGEELFFSRVREKTLHCPSSVALYSVVGQCK